MSQVHKVTTTAVLQDLRRNYMRDIPQIEKPEDQEECARLCAKVALDLCNLNNIEKLGKVLTIQGMNWCDKYNHEIDYDLVHGICQSLHPKGCANCEHHSYKTVIEKGCSK